MRAEVTITADDGTVIVQGVHRLEAGSIEHIFAEPVIVSGSAIGVWRLWGYKLIPTYEFSNSLDAQ